MHIGVDTAHILSGFMMPAEWTQSCIDVRAARLRQQAGDTDGLWWLSCRLCTATGEMRRFIFVFTAQGKQAAVLSLAERRKGAVTLFLRGWDLLLDTSQEVLMETGF